MKLIKIILLMIYIFKSHSSGYEDSFSPKEYKKKEFLKKYTAQTKETIEIFKLLCGLKEYNTLKKELIENLKNLKNLKINIKSVKKFTSNIDNILKTLNKDTYTTYIDDISTDDISSSEEKALKIFNAKLANTATSSLSTLSEIVDAMEYNSSLLTKDIPYYYEQKNILNTLEYNKNNNNKLITLSINILKNIQVILQELKNSTIDNEDENKTIEQAIINISAYYHNFFNQLIDQKPPWHKNITLFLIHGFSKIENLNNDEEHIYNNFINLLHNPDKIIIIKSLLTYWYLRSLENDLFKNAITDIEKKKKYFSRGTSQELKELYRHLMREKAKAEETIGLTKDMIKRKKIIDELMNIENNNKKSLLQKGLTFLRRIRAFWKFK